MRKVFGIIFLLGFYSFARAEKKDPILPLINSYVSQAVYISTNVTASLTLSTNTADVAVSTNSALIHTICVNTAGSGSTFKFYDGRVATATARILGTIDTTAKVSYTYDIGVSSGLLIWNQGTTAADVTLTYVERR